LGVEGIAVGKAHSDPIGGGAPATCDRRRGCPTVKALVWTAVITLVAFAILLPMVIVTSTFAGQPLWRTIALIGLMGLALGVALYVWSRVGTR